jgi:hypothetical protein
VNLIDFDILRIRTAEQRVFKESSSGQLDGNKKTFGAAGWLVCLTYFFKTRTRRRESSKHVYFLCSPSRDLLHNMVKAKHVPFRKLSGFLTVDVWLFSSQFRHIVDYFYVGYIFSLLRRPSHG